MTFKMCFVLAIQAAWIFAFNCQAAPAPRLLPAPGSANEALAPVECRDALLLAPWAYYGPEFIPDVPDGNPLGLKSQLILKPEPINSCFQSSPGEGNAIDSTRLPRLVVGERFRYQFDDAYSAAFIHMKPFAGHWLALGTDWVRNNPAYVVFLLPEKPTPAEVRNMTQSVVLNGQSKSPSPAAQSTMPPRLYERKDGAQPWIFLREDGFVERAGPLAPWSVLTIGDDGLKARCTVGFISPEEDALDILPALGSLLGLLDETMGSGSGEGTYNATSRLRSHARSIWINILFRPWVTTLPYNSRKAVDKQLADWAARSPENRRTERTIRRQLPLAEVALARHYQRKFGLQTSEAKRVAAFQLDVGFRSHFKFSETTTTHPAGRIVLNPWPARAFPDRLFSQLEPHCGPRKSPPAAD